MTESITTPVPVAAAVPESPSVAVPSGEAKDPRLAQKFAALSKKEAAAVKRLQAATSKEQEIAQREASLRSETERLQALRSDPMKAMEYLGLNYNQLTQTLLNEGKVPAEVLFQRLEQRLTASEQNNLQLQQQQAQAAQQAELAEQNDYVTSFKDEIGRTVSDKNTFKLINHFDRSDLVYETIDAQFQKTGQIMPIADAAKLVEDYLVQEVKKSQSLLQPPEPPQAAVKAPISQKFQDSWRQQSTSKPTLTNAATPTTAPPKPQRWTSREEDIQRALAKYGVKK